MRNAHTVRLSDCLTVQTARVMVDGRLEGGVQHGGPSSNFPLPISLSSLSVSPSTLPAHPVVGSVSVARAGWPSGIVWTDRLLLGCAVDREPGQAWHGSRARI